MSIQMFLDLDGTIADFDAMFEDTHGLHPRKYEAEHGVKKFWSAIRNHEGGFFNQLDKMHDADELVDAVMHLNPTFLTGVPFGGWAEEQKLKWRDKHYPDIKMICCPSKEKYLNMHPDKHNVIVDDWHKYKTIWEDNKGTFILHTSAKDSIKQLQELGII